MFQREFAAKLDPSVKSAALRKHVKCKAQLRYDDQNFYVLSTNGNKYVLKVMNLEDSKNSSLIEVQTYAMSFLHQHHIPAQTATATVSGKLMSLEELDCGFGPQRYLVRLLSYLPGKTISKVPHTPQILFDVGKMAAKMDKVLQKMEHPNIAVLERDGFIWSLSNFLVVEKYMHVLNGEPALKEAVKSVIELYKTTVVPKYPHFRSCVNHGDFNDLNVLAQVDDDGCGRICGILDFGDMNSGFYVHELAIAIMYMMIEHPNPIEVGRWVLAGWETEIPLIAAERECLYVLVLCRFCQSMVFARHSVLLHPENEEYLMVTSRKGVHILQDICKLGKQHVEGVWFRSAVLPN
uniref:Hydroxylysine kinase n=1 Tax=Knipowitschia caucasica TaxID=637954 RepID=A0AAV2KW82_KNICA